MTAMLESCRFPTVNIACHCLQLAGGLQWDQLFFLHSGWLSVGWNWSRTGIRWVPGLQLEPTNACWGAQLVMHCPGVHVRWVPESATHVTGWKGAGQAVSWHATGVGWHETKRVRFCCLLVDVEQLAAKIGGALGTCEWVVQGGLTANLGHSVWIALAKAPEKSTTFCFAPKRDRLRCQPDNR